MQVLTRCPAPAARDRPSPCSSPGWHGYPAQLALMLAHSAPQLPWPAKRSQQRSQPKPAGAGQQLGKSRRLAQRSTFELAPARNVTWFLESLLPRTAEGLATRRAPAGGILVQQRSAQHQRPAPAHHRHPNAGLHSFSYELTLPGAAAAVPEALALSQRALHLALASADLGLRQRNGQQKRANCRLVSQA
jgi:hypothetical protein